jgi:regulatory protein NPR1
MEPPPTSHVTTAFSDSDSVSMEVSGDAPDPDLEALRRLSDNLAAAFRSPQDFAFLADASVAVPGAPDLRVHRCVLAARSPFLRDVFARRAGAPPGAEGVRLDLRELLGDEVEVGYEALQLVLDYLYSGRVVRDLPKSACACVDDDGCRHVGCHPAVSFMAQVLFAACTFQVVELTSLFQVRISPLPCSARTSRHDFFISDVYYRALLLGCASAHAFRAPEQQLLMQPFACCVRGRLLYAAKWA